MSIQEIIDNWLAINFEGYSNYFHDFIYGYCESGKVSYVFPITNNDNILGARMVPKDKLHERIRKYSNCDELYYHESAAFNPHNPYHDSVGQLYICADNAKDYLKKWLLFIIYQKLITDQAMFGKYSEVFKELCYQLIQEYDICFGNAKYLLPLMEKNHHMRDDANTIWLILYKLKAEMNYVKANHYFVLLKEERGWTKLI